MIAKENLLFLVNSKKEGVFKGLNVKVQLTKNLLEVEKMQKRTCYVLGLLIVLFLGSSIVLGGDSGVCPLPSRNNQAVLSPSGEAVTAPAENPTVPRNCVLLELFASTT